jgi:hypothetical protein
VLFETHRNWRECIISRRVFHQRMAPVRKQIEALLRQAVGAKIARLSGSCQDILDHQQALWTFVDRRGASFVAGNACQRVEAARKKAGPTVTCEK